MDNNALHSENSNLTIVVENHNLLSQAQVLAEHLNISLVEGFYSGEGLSLVINEQGLALVDGNMKLISDLTKITPRIIPGKLQRELLIRAAKVKKCNHPIAIDATAGFGEDSLLLAASGFEVYLFEQDPIIAALLKDGLQRVASDRWLGPLVRHMTVFEENSIKAMNQWNKPVDVVFLDPMFPERRKSASVKKKFQLLHQLEKPCEDENALLEAAYTTHPKKIVIKRPVKGPYLGKRKPSYSLSGKAVRYDCIVLPPE